MLDLLEDHLVLRDIPFLRLDGSVSRARREMVIRMVGYLAHLYSCRLRFHFLHLVPARRFSSVSSHLIFLLSAYRHPEYKVFLISTKAGGLGRFLFHFIRYAWIVFTNARHRHQPDQGVNVHLVRFRLEPSE
jgi:hypothetical protein